MLPLNTIVCGDNIEVMREWPDECIDLVCTSPPYDNVYYSPDGNLITDSGNGLRTYDGYSWDFAAVARELWRVIKPGGVVVWVVGDAMVKGSETGSSFRQALYFMSLGFNCETMIYEVAGTGAKGSNYYYWQTFEYMFVLSKGQPKTSNRIADIKNPDAGKTRGFRTKSARNGSRIDRTYAIIPEYSIRPNVWRYAVGQNDNCEHSAPFPEALAHDHIISWSNPGAIVLDPFCGSGTTAKMAAILDRKYIGIDCSESYCNLARRRVANVKRELRGEWKPLQDTDGAFEGLPLLEGIEG